MTQLSIIAGLGNPEEKYERTLHNAGFWFVDAIARKYGGRFRYEHKCDADCCKVSIDSSEIWLVKPQDYMNHSGAPVRAVLDYYRLNPRHMLVAHDEIDLPPGTVRLKQGGGHGGHNGIRDQVTGYVLKRGSAEVERAIEDNIDEAVAVLPLLLDQGLNSAMKQLHTKGD